MKSFEQIVNHEQLKDGTLVVVEVPDIIKFPAMIIGLSTNQFFQTLERITQVVVFNIISVSTPN